MKQIQVAVLNPQSIWEAEQMMAFTARLTQRGHTVKNLDDIQELYNKPYSTDLLYNLTKLPHPTIQKFEVINVAIVGASRRFLAQITRHQNEVKFMSASLQYSDYSDNADFCVPYEVIQTNSEQEYINTQKKQMEAYMDAVELVGHDAAGYLAPQGLRNALIISATPYQWKHMIGQRTCRRNTTETRYIMLKIWDQLYRYSPILFDSNVTGAFCQRGKCQEGKMCCGKAIPKAYDPEDIIKEDFPLLYKREE